MSIMSRFSCVVLSLTRQLYNDLELVQTTNSKLILRILSIVDLIEALMSKP